MVNKAREEKGVSQTQLAQAIGVTQSAIAQIELGNAHSGSGKRGGMYLSTMYKIAKYFKKSIDWFLGEEIDGDKRKNEVLKKRIKLLEQTITEHERLLKLKKVR